MENKSNLYSRAEKKNLERPKISNHILNSKYTSKNTNPISLRPKTNENISNIANSKKEKPKSSISKSSVSAASSAKQSAPPKKQISNSRVVLPSIVSFNNQKARENYFAKKQKEDIAKAQRNSKYKSYKPLLKENNLYNVLLYLDLESLCNFSLTCKKFNKIALNCDDLWFHFYAKKFALKSNPINYEDHRGQWRKHLVQTCMSISARNFENLKKKFLTKYKKNIYVAKKDHYFLSNNLYLNLAPEYHIKINDDTPIPIKNILTNKILSHVNFYVNFDVNYKDMNRIKTITLFLSEKKIGIFMRPIAYYDVKKMKFELTDTEENLKISKVFKVYYNNELIISTFEKNFIFFINISLPICKICERLFDFLHGIHDINLHYEDDIDSKFGLYNYSLLINLKSWNRIYYSLLSLTCDFKEDLNYPEYELYNVNTSCVANSYKVKFDIKTICMKDCIDNFLICDVVLRSEEGDHVLCESKPIVIKPDAESVDYDEYDSKSYYALIDDGRYYVKFNFKFSPKNKYYALVRTEMRLNKKFIEKIFIKY